MPAIYSIRKYPLSVKLRRAAIRCLGQVYGAGKPSARSKMCQGRAPDGNDSLPVGHLLDAVIEK